MRRIAIAAIAIVGLVSTGAFAAANTATGAIKTLDGKACAVTLATSKSVYSFGKTCDFSKLKIGEKVTIAYTVNSKTYLATAIKAA